MNIHTPEAVAVAEVAQEPAVKETRFYTLMRPRGNWICKCGIGNYPSNHRCVACREWYISFEDKISLQEVANAELVDRKRLREIDAEAEFVFKD